MGELRTGTSSRGEWRRQQFILEVGEYKDPVAFEALGEAIDALDGIKDGTPIEVTFTLRSRKWQERWYSDINAVEIEEQDLPF